MIQYSNVEGCFGLFDLEKLKLLQKRQNKRVLQSRDNMILSLGLAKPLTAQRSESRSKQWLEYLANHLNLKTTKE